MIGSQVRGRGSDDDVGYGSTPLGIVLAFNVPIEDTCFSCESEVEYLVAVALTHLC
jgi:hypothetical protein